MKISLENFDGAFNLFHTLQSEQCPVDLWRFKEAPYTYIEVEKKWIKIKVKQNKTFISVIPSQELSKSKRKILKKKVLELFWANYPLEDFYTSFSSDSYVSKIINLFRGLRVMKSQNLSWSLIEAINSQNTTVEQVRERDRLFRKHYGEKISFRDGESFRTFPKLSKIDTLEEQELREKCKVGYRAPYLLNAAKNFTERDLQELGEVNAEKARKRLLQVKGIGPKVSDIFLLYGLGKPDVFPMDVHLKRAIRREYFTENVSKERLRDFALKKFGKHAGFAHLYMFYFERKWHAEA